MGNGAIGDFKPIPYNHSRGNLPEAVGLPADTIKSLFDQIGRAAACGGARVPKSARVEQVEKVLMGLFSPAEVRALATAIVIIMEDLMEMRGGVGR